jgi:glucan phosphoethanolaminetransferase (alkaline phosphatase superfamily)
VTETSPAGRERNPRRTLAVVAGAGLLLVATFFFAVSVLPRWWAQRVGSQVDGSLTTGLILGVMYGFLCTLFPIAVLAFVARFKRRSWISWLVGVGLALVLASPVLVTLGIVLGTGDAAHAGDRTLDVEAPWFRGGMLIGVVSAVAVAAWVWWEARSGSRARARAREASQTARRPDDGPS